MNNIVVFASGSGTNFQSVIDAVEEGRIKADISGLIAGNPDIQAIERARNHDIPVQVVKKSDFKDIESFEKELLEILNTWDADYIVLAGYLQKIPPGVIESYKNRIINIHPSLLPKYGGKGYYGRNVHEAVIENGEQESGCTVHLVNEVYDEGPILAQRKVPVYSSDTPDDLADRVLEEEHKLLPEVLANLINEKS